MRAATLGCPPCNLGTGVRRVRDAVALIKGECVGDAAGLTGDQEVVRIIHIDRKGWKCEEAAGEVGDQRATLATTAMFAHRQKADLEVGNVKNIPEPGGVRTKSVDSIADALDREFSGAVGDCDKTVLEGTVAGESREIWFHVVGGTAVNACLIGKGRGGPTGATGKR